MKVFNVLDRNQDIHSSYLLEASAGTGKTFSIENIVVRLLIDLESPCNLSSILIVTFTKAATADLKLRVRRHICKALAFLQGKSSEIPPDYLQALLENESGIEYAQQQLEEALACFEQAPIFTIHGFCHRMLKEYLFEGDTSAALSESEEGVSPVLLSRLVKDFFRMELSEKLVSEGQLKRALSAFKGVERLEKELLGLVTKGIEIVPFPSIQELLQDFLQAMPAVKKAYSWVEHLIVEDFCMLAPFYKEICNQQKQPKEEYVEKVERFAAMLIKEEWDLVDFDLLIKDGLYIVDAFNPNNRTKSKQPVPLEKLHYPELCSLLDSHLGGIVNTARNPYKILCTMAHRCKEQIKTFLKNKEIIGFDDLLTNMHRAVQKASFADKVRERFSIAIIDEFQDTDPIQWEIFRAIFRPKDKEAGRLYLVGDPKQSIYGFRQADIYTYLAAGESLGDEAKASLDTNYRSTSQLVEALNILFSNRTASNLISLPRLGKMLPYQPVQWGGKIESKYKDERGALHFFAFEGKGVIEGEESYFIPYIAQELLHLQSEGIPLSSCAVLVGDRFQGFRVKEYLEKKGLPTVAQHCESLVESVAFEAFQEILESIILPQKESALKIALGGPLIGWTEEEILAIKDPYALEPMIAKTSALKRIWSEKGFSIFYQSFLASSWKESHASVMENMVRRTEGLEFFHSIQQIAELLIEKDSQEQLPPVRLMEYLLELKKLEEGGEPIIKKRTNPEKEGVRILTIHSSKGLEFEVVFALGVVKRSQKPSMLIPVIQAEHSYLIVADSYEDERYIQYAKELDAEKIRQLYVAFTRAKQRLYVPLFFHAERKKCEIGTASPIELYLARMAAPDEDVYSSISTLCRNKCIDRILDLGKSCSITITEDISTPKVISEEANLVSLERPPEAKIPGNPLYMHSFTSLSVKESLLSEQRPPNDYDNSLKSVHTLPAGSPIGILLHKILEKIPFNIVLEGRNSEIFRDLIREFVEGTPFKEWCEVIETIIYDALTATLKMESGEFQLMHLQEMNCYREHLFVYSADDQFHPEFEKKPGYVKGVIDLLFQHQGKYYLLDWKSNWLGPNEEYYTEFLIEEAMNQNDYYLQADIYKEALRRYLSLVDPRPFEKIYGGAFYLFLRGLTLGKVSTVVKR